MPQTAWSIMIRMTSSSSAPKMFAALADAAKEAGESVEAAQKTVVGFGAASDEAAEQVGILNKEAAGLTRSTVALSRSTAGLSKSFNGAAGAAGRFSKVTGEAAASAEANFAAIDVASANMARNTGGNLLKSSTAANVANKALIGLGITSAVVFAIGVKGASDFQNATLQSAIAMGRMGGTLDQTMTKMGDFQQVAFNMSKITGQSMSDSMGVVSSMASSGLNANQIKAAATPIAQYGDIMKYGVAPDKSMSYAASATLGAGLVHDLRLGLSGNNAVDAANTAYGLARIAQLSYLSPHGPNAVGTQIRRMAPTLETFLPGDTRSKATQITGLAAWVDRMGMLPFAGSAIAQMATQFIQPRSARVGDALFDLGIQTQHGRSKGMQYIPAPLTASPFFDKKTQTFDIMGALAQVGKAVASGKKSGDLTAFSALFGGTQNMQRIMVGLSTAEAGQAKKNINAQLAAMGQDPVAWMAAAQMQVMSTLAGQVGILSTNFQTMAQLLTNGLIPPLTTIANFLQNSIGKFDQALIDHPDAAKLGGEGLLMAGVAGILALLKAGHNFIRFFALLGKNPHIGTIVGERLTSAAGGTAGIATDAVRAAETVGTLGVLKNALIGPMGVFMKNFGSKFIPVVGELALLYTALQLLVGAFAWLNQLLGIHKQANTPTTHDERAAAQQDFRPRVLQGGTGRPGQVRSAAAGPYSPVVLPANTGLGRGKVVHLASGGRVSADGLAYLHKGETVVNTRLTQRLESSTAGASHVHHTFGKLELTGSPLDNMSSADKNDLAEMIGDRIAAKITRDTVYARGGTQVVATDEYGGSSYHSEYGVAG